MSKSIIKIISTKEFIMNSTEKFPKFRPQEKIVPTEWDNLNTEDISSLWEDFKRSLGINIRPQEKIVPTEWDNLNEEERWSDSKMFDHFSNIEDSLCDFKYKLNAKINDKFITGFIFDLDEDINTFIYEGISYGIK